MAVHLVCLTVELHLPGCSSLKEKRRRLKPLLTQLHKHFNISAAEVDLNDAHQAATVACAVVTNHRAHGQQLLDKIPDWIERRWPDIQIVDHDLWSA